MKNIKSLADILAQPDSQDELYTSDQKKRKRRAKRGYYTKKDGVFSFINLIKKWDLIVGEFMAANTIPLKIKNKTLIVSTKHSIFAQELGFLTPEIIQKINQLFPDLEGQVKSIKYLHSNIFEPSQERNETPQRTRKLHPQSPEFKQLKKKAQTLTQDFEDAEVIAAIEKFILG